MSEIGLLEPERDAVKADAVAVLRTALITGEDVPAALRWCWYRNLAYGAALFTETVRARFARDCDIRDLTVFIGRHQEAGFPSREAEALMRAALGEVAMFDAVDPGQFSYPEIAIAVLGWLFTEWRPGADDVAALLDRVEVNYRVGQETTPWMAAAEGDWFDAGMHESPFAWPLEQADEA